MKNFTLDILDRLSPYDYELADWPTEALAELQKMLEAEKKLHDKRQAVWWAEMNRRFAWFAQQRRQADGKDTGTVHLVSDGFDVEAEVKKNVLWDETALRKALGAMPAARAKYYAHVELSVPEAKYAAAPPEEKKLLETARSVKPAKPSYKLKRVES